MEWRGMEWFDETFVSEDNSTTMVVKVVVMVE